MRRTLVLLVVAVCVPACSYRWIERRVDALQEVVDDATRAGAATCAPVELALSRVHLEFARAELKEGDAPRAERHLTLAEPNGQAALRLAKERKCSEQASALESSAFGGHARSPVSTSPVSSSPGPRLDGTAQRGTGGERVALFGQAKR